MQIFGFETPQYHNYKITCRNLCWNLYVQINLIHHIRMQTYTIVVVLLLAKKGYTNVLKGAEVVIN